MVTYCSTVHFNSLKHHLDSLRNFVDLYQEVSGARLRMLLLPLGASQMDVYTGALSTGEILCQVEKQLDNQDLLSKKAFQDWIQRLGGFATVTLSDSSRWVLRVSDTEQFVHLHPGRYSPHTIRAKARPLKTAIAALIAARQQNRPVDLALVNEVRTHWLLFSPVKEVTRAGETGKLIRLLSAGRT